jgi:two-component system, chemotaxis family, chemotaxis protein CheY
MKILVVDDSKAMRMIVTRTVRQATSVAHTIVEAENGRMALEVIAQGGVDLILCDWNMPEMNGLELLKTLRSSGRMIRFGFVTSESTPEMRLQAQQAGASFLIAKPFSPDNFTDLFARLGV